MTTKQTEREYPNIGNSTLIKTGWLCAQYMHGQDVPAWLHQTLASVRQQAAKCQLSVVVVPACGREDNLVVMTLGDFLLWSHRRAVFNVSIVASCSDAYPSKEE